MAKDMLSADLAREIILQDAAPLEAEEVALEDSYGRVLAQDVHATEEVPPFANSAMDGYAVRAADTAGAGRESPRRLQVIAEAAAGAVVAGTVRPETAVRIMTGAPMPAGADAVVMVEETRAADDVVFVFREARAGDNVRPAGEDAARGERVLQAGTRIGPAELGMLARLGATSMQVYRQPRVAIVTTGDEIVDVGVQPGPGQIRDSNRYALFGQVLRAGALPTFLARVSDERGELAAALRQAAEQCDAILTSGGVSVGEYDFVKDTLAQLGEINFWRVAIKPGKPLAYGRILGKPLFGLPGNPVSSMVAFDLFVAPALLAMMGRTTALRPVTGLLTADLRHKPGRREFVRARVGWQSGGYLATPTGAQGSGRLSSMLGANAYLIIPEEIGDVHAGETVRVLFME